MLMRQVSCRFDVGCKTLTNAGKCCLGGVAYAGIHAGSASVMASACQSAAAALFDIESMVRQLSPSSAYSEDAPIRWPASEQLLFGKELVAAELVTAEQFHLALRHASAAETSIGHALVYTGAITQRHLMRFLEEYDEAACGLNRPLADLSSSGSTIGTMTEDDSRILRDWDDQLCPTLKKNYDIVQKLERIPICVACPMAQWYKLETVPPTSGTTLTGDAEPKPPTLECFCTAFRGIMYDGRRVVTACDAFQDALDKQDDAGIPNG